MESKNRDNFIEEVKSETREGITREGVRGDVEDLVIAHKDGFSVAEFTLERDKGKEVRARLIVDDVSGEVVERYWIEKEGTEERTIRYENVALLKRMSENAAELEGGVLRALKKETRDN